MKTIFLAALYFFCLAVQELRAQQTVYASYKYVMGDNETKVDAKKICFNEAKRRCIERAGTYLESVTEVRNFQLKNDEIIAYAAAVLKVEIVSEEIMPEGESFSISMTVKAAVDTTNIDQKIQRLKNEKKLDSKLKEQQDKIQRMEQKLDSLKNRLSKIDSSKRVPQNNFFESDKNKSPQAPPKEITVYITRTGQKYHRAGCSSLRRSMIPLSLNEAKKRYLPCSVCSPPN